MQKDPKTTEKDLKQRFEKSSKGRPVKMPEGPKPPKQLPWGGRRGAK